MTRDQLEYLIVGIKECVDDDEQAHGKEDNMYQELLQAIADGCDNAQALAQRAVQAHKEFKHARWCA